MSEVPVITAAEYQSLRAKPRRHKYRAIPTVVDGIRFDSKREAVHFQELKLRERAGEIHDLRRQVPYRFTLDGQHVFTYVADCTYSVEGDGLHVEDVKGFDTPLGRLKRRLIEAQYRIKIGLVK